MNPTRALLVAALLTGLAAGCTTTSTGDPRPADTTTSGDSTESTSTAPPTRPREITLDTIDPCALIPQSDYPDYYMEEPGKPKKSAKGAPECIWTGTRVGYFSVTLVMYEGVDALQESRLGEAEPAEPIAEFPTYSVVLPDDENACFVAVDVAEGQYLITQVGMDNKLAGLPPICEYTHQFAASAMSTLVKS